MTIDEMRNVVDAIVSDCRDKNMSTNETIDACYDANDCVREMIKCHTYKTSRENDVYDVVIMQTLMHYDMHDNYN